MAPTRPLTFVLLVLTIVVLPGCRTPVEETAPTEIVLASEIEWEKLNPARGDRSPQAGTLWGDRNGKVPTGFLAKFVDGFASPPHIHNATYRAVVIEGLIHNDDPDAARMWMPVGSFWTQPKGEVHITAASGSTSIALVEIDEGPYLVRPPDEAFDSGERPVNVDATNIVWVGQVAYLWGDLREGQTRGTFVRLPAGFDGELRTGGGTFRAVVITGQVRHAGADATLTPGSYVGSNGESVHQVASGGDEAAILYVRSEDTYEVAER